METGVYLNHTPTYINNVKIENIIKVLKEGEKIKYTKQGNVVLFLGNSGSGKTTSVQFIAGNNNDLISQEVREDTGEFIIIDKNNKISYNSTISSKTTYPEMLINTNTVFYDCPGFSDTRSPAYDISATYFTKKLIDSSNSLKLIFVISYPSVRQGVDRHDFMLLVRHATTMINNIDKFQDNIALLVTKVDNDYIKKKGKFLLVPDFQIINKIADFLKLARDELKTKVDSTENYKEFHKKAITFIDILLTKQGDTYSKIGIFRRPDESGPLSQIQLLQKERIFITELIENNLNFVSHVESDFSYTISAESKNYVHDLIDEINKAINIKFKNIGKSIKNYYINLENRISDLNELHNKFQTADNDFSEIKNTNQFKKPYDAVQTIYKYTNRSGISVANEDLLNVLNFNKYLNFLETVSSSNESENNALIWTEGFKEVIDFIGKKKTLYNFLIDLYNRLSEYDIQKNIKNYDIVNLKAQITLLKQQPRKQKFITDLPYLKKLLEKVINSNDHLEYNNIKDVSINDRALDFLTRVLDETLNFNLTISKPMSHRLVIKGNFVKLSDVISLASSSSIKFIDIMALNIIFIDASLDKSGTIIQLSIIAPKWEIIGSQQLILDGKSGEFHYPQQASNGYDGDAGYPGGSAGCFFGLGQTFINSQYLSISIVGGSGGPGQNGGNGLDGRNGEDPPLQEDDERDPWDKGNFTYSAGYTLTIMRKFFFFSKEYEHESRYVVYGKNGTDGGNGCNGGVGGKGGNMGKLFIINLNDKDKSQILTKALDGIPGSPGSGGQPGKPGKNGKKIKVYYHRYWTNKDDYTVRHDIHYEEDYLSPRTTGVIGKYGTSFKNYQYPKEVNFDDLPQIINSYKNYIRDNLDKNTQNLVLRYFFNRIENNEHVSSLYDTKSFYDEFINFEKQIILFQDPSEMLPYYQSLLNRIIKYAEHPKTSENLLEYKKVLAYLNTAVVARIYNVDKKIDPTLVLDMNSYMSEISNNIKKLQNTKNISLSLDFYSKDQDEIKVKINKVKVSLDTEINTDIKNIITITDNGLELLLNTTQRGDENILILDDENVDSMLSEEENGHELNEIIISKADKTVSTFLVLNESKINDIEKIQLVQDLILKIKQLSNKSIFKKHLNTDELLKFFDEKNLNLLEDNFVKKIQNLTSNADISIKDLLIEVENQRKIDATKENSSSKYEIFNLIENILIIDDISFDIFDKIKYNFAKIERLVEIIKKNKEQIHKIQLFKQNIFKTVTLTCQSILNLLQNKIHAFIDFKESNIQDNLNNIRIELRHISKEVKINENLYRSLEKIEGLIVSIINIYDSLETNFNQAKLIGNIKNIKSTEAGVIIINNIELSNIINKLEQVINNNLILGQYQKLLNAYSQRIFPFGFNVNELLKSDYTEQNYQSEIEKAIALLGLKFSNKISVSQFDSHIHNNVEFNSKYVETTPFFVWEYDTIKEAIGKLLTGDEIRVRADITKGVDKYAVKYNKIGINIKLENQTLQNELNSTLQNYGISLTHHGDSNYKYGRNIYTILSDKNTIYYTLETKSNGEPVDKNKVYDFIKNNDCMLSPYATWSIKFTNVNNSFNSLSKFRNETLQIELEGQGQYIAPDIEFSSDHNIKQYYKYDECLSEIDNNEEDIDKILNDLKSRNATIARQRRALIEESNSSFIDSIFTFIKNYLTPLKKLNILNKPTFEMNEIFDKKKEINENKNILNSKLTDEPVTSNRCQLSGKENSNIGANKVDFGWLDVQSTKTYFYRFI
ncbi:unnamed protein product [Psylliodes chrysocephalus]|uniref:Uncharacterized protein n=1 Tax=Psylliodes chrysocephalus TaxID=3402493 RepID=A0A9P0D4P7_9CUCU|nr:unnamed protein product [Psylliodes chrysocephala]